MAPPIKKKDFTFLGWVEDVFNAPKDLGSRTYAVLQNKYNQTYVLWQVRATATEGDITDEDVVTAFTQGAESLSDLTGINVQLSLKKLIQDPKKTVRILGEKTFQDIANIDDLSGYRRGEIVRRLTQGYTTDGLNKGRSTKKTLYEDDGKALDEPDNLYLQGLRKAGKLKEFSAPYLDRSAGKARSKMKLVVDLLNGSDPNFNGDWEDRRIAEENLSREKQHKAYSQLAGAATMLASNVEFTGPRLRSRINTNVAYSRVLMTELGIDLDQVFNTRRFASIEQLDGKKVYDQAGREQKIDPHLVGTNYDTMGSFHKTLIDPSKGAGDIHRLVSDPGLIEEALGMGPGEFKNLAEETQNLLKTTLILEDLELRNSVIGPSDGFSKIVHKWERLGLKPELDNTNYNNHFQGAMLRGDLEHLRNQYATKAYVISEGAKGKIRADLSKRLNDKLPGPQNAALRSQLTNRALDRLDAAEATAQMSNNLFAVAAMRDLFEKVRDGDFVEAAIVSSRFLGMLPNAPKELRGTGEWISVFEPRNLEAFIDDKILGKAATNIATSLGLKDKKGNLQPGIVLNIINPLRAGRLGIEKIQVLAGLRIERDGANQQKLLPLYRYLNEHGPTKGFFNATSYVEWKSVDAAGNPLGRTSFWAVKSSDAQGLFGGDGVFDLFSDYFENFPDRCADPRLGRILKPDALFENLDELDSLMEDMKFIIDNPMAVLPENQFALKELMHSMGLLNSVKDEYGNLIPIFDKYYNSYVNKFKPHGRRLLENLENSKGMLGIDGLHKKDRWLFLKSLKSNGKAKQLADLYATWFEKYGRAANAINNFIQKNLIFGDFLFTLPIVGNMIRPILQPVQGLLRTAGFDGEAGLYAVVSKWKWVVKLDNSLGAIKNKILSGAGGRVAGQTALKAAGQILSKMIGPVLKILGMGASTASAAVTAGISLVLTQLAQTGFKMTLKLLRFDLNGAFKVLFDDIAGVGKGITKVGKIIGGCLFACCLSPFLIGMIFTAILIPGTIAPLEKFGAPTPPNSMNDQSTMFNVIKTATKADLNAIGRHQRIDYTITVMNTSDVPITIAGIDDSLMLNKGECGALESYRITDPGFVGRLEDYDLASLVGQTIQPGGFALINYKLTNIEQGVFGQILRATYINTIQISIAEDPDKKRTAIATVDLGEGACRECPSGIPFASSSFLGVSQCPGSDTTGTHVGSSYESIDWPLAVGTPIYATSDGVAAVSISNTGYGNHIVITGSQGYQVYYAHLSVVLIDSGPVTKGTLIGESGGAAGASGSGNSSGPHLHYEFRGSCGGDRLTISEPFIPSAYLGSCR